MKAFYFSEAQADMLLNLMINRAVAGLVGMGGVVKDRAQLIETCEVIAALQNGVEIGPQPGLGAYLSADVTINDELPPIILPEYDPRARNPRCVHGVPFKDENGDEVPCERCKANWTDARLRGDTPIGQLHEMGETAFKEAQVLSGANRVDPE